MAENTSKFSRNKVSLVIVLVVLLMSGFLVRMIDLTDEPLEFHPLRQLRAAIIARNFFLKAHPEANAEFNIFLDDQEMFDFVTRREPPITEALVAGVYLMVGRETLWVSRIITSLFWIIGGLGVFQLVRHLATDDSALISLGVYLFLPFGILGSRSFQPEALFIASMVWALVLFHRWIEDPVWKWAILCGLLSGFSILVKPTALFILLPVYLFLVLNQDGWRKSIGNLQIWVLAGLSGVSAFVYYFLIYPSAGGFLNHWWIDIARLIPTRRFFLGWGNIVLEVIPFPVLILAFVSIVLSKGKQQLLLLGLWVGYGLLAISVPHYISTHSYYSLVLVPITAISLGNVAAIIAKAGNGLHGSGKALLVMIAVAAMAYPVWEVTGMLLAEDFRGEAVKWQKIATALPEEAEVIGLSENYGKNLAYYGNRKITWWPTKSELALQTAHGQVDALNFDVFFDDMTGLYDFFLVDDFQQYQAQLDLVERLSEFPVYDMQDEFVIYNLSGN